MNTSSFFTTDKGRKAVLDRDVKAWGEATVAGFEASTENKKHVLKHFLYGIFAPLPVNNIFTIGAIILKFQISCESLLADCKS